MAHTFTCLYYHIVFGTRFRRPLITPEMRPRLWAYMGGIARENRLRALTINGMADHAHMLISLNPAIALADAIKEILNRPAIRRDSLVILSVDPTVSRWATLGSCRIQRGTGVPPASGLFRVRRSLDGLPPSAATSTAGAAPDVPDMGDKV